MVDQHGRERDSSRETGREAGRHQDSYPFDAMPRMFLSTETRQAVRERVRIKRAWRRHRVLVLLIILACLVIATMVGLLILRLV